MSRWTRRLRALFRRRKRIPTLPPAEAYGLLAPAYPPRPHNPLMKVEQTSVERLLPPLAGKVVLDLACGTGRYLHLAEAAGARRAVGLDVSLAMLRAGQGQIAQGEMTRLPFPTAAFDVIICGLAFGHLPPAAMRAALREAGRSLKPGGVLVFSDFHPYLALNGGQRAFTLPGGQTIAIEHHIYFPSDYFAAVTEALMILTAVDEPVATMRGKRVPAVLTMRCERRRENNL